ncbi:MAG: terminase small subunit [Lachnospiraceae bacterium]
MAKLTAKQQRFCDEYLVSLNATQAAVKSGYSKKYANTNASKLLQNTTIKEYIEKRMAEKESKLIADQDEILRYLTSVIRGESKSTEIVVEGTGDGCSEARTILKEPSEKDRLKAAELLGKRYGIYTEKVDMDVNIPVMFAGEDDLEE